MLVPFIQAHSNIVIRKVNRGILRTLKIVQQRRLVLTQYHLVGDRLTFYGACSCVPWLVETLVRWQDVILDDVDVRLVEVAPFHALGAVFGFLAQLGHYFLALLRYFASIEGGVGVFFLLADAIDSYVDELVLV